MKGRFIIEQYYSPFTNWEDYQNGMYETTIPDIDNSITNAIKLLTDHDEFYIACDCVINEWKISSAVNLTNINYNMRAWLGQAACCFKYGIPEMFTKKAWGMLTDKQRDDANNIADKIIAQYHKQWRRGLDNTLIAGKKGVIPMGYQMKLQLD